MMCLKRSPYEFLVITHGPRWFLTIRVDVPVFELVGPVAPPV